MTHLKIEQNTTGIEEVSSAVIKKLYDLVYSGTLDNTSNLLGRLHTTSTYLSYVDYLTGLYPNLYITANKYYMNFADPLVELILLQYDCGDGTGITLNDVAGYRIGTGELFYRQPITSFDEFLYFTSPSFTYTASLFCLECSQLTSIKYPPLMQIISGNSHLENTSLTSIDLRNTSLTQISNGAFYGCTALTTVNIPDTCTTLGNGAFENCTNLSSIDLSHITTFGNGVLRSCVNLTTANLYNATSMGTQCFMGSGLTSVDFTGSTITSIPTDTFNGCANLTTITLPSTITSLGNSAFANCTSLQSLTLNCPSLNSIDEYAFYQCNNLNYIDLSKTCITTASQHMLYNSCASMTIRLPKTLTYLRANYVNFDQLTTVYITGLENVQTWEQSNHAFYKGTILTPLYYKGTHNWPSDIFAAQNRGSTLTCNSFFYPNITTIGNAHGELYSRFLQNPIVGYLPHTSGNIFIKLLYFKDLQTMGYAMFFRCIIDNLVINNVNVPSYDTTSGNIDLHTNEFDESPFGFGSNINNTQIGTLWVPDVAVSAYQASPLFAGITIKGINTKTNGVDYDLPRYATFADWEVAADAAKLAGNPLPVALIEEYM